MPAYRMDRAALVAAACCSLLAALPVRAHDADAAHGAKLARDYCAGCHRVSPQSKSEKLAGPDFAAIARTPHYTSERLRRIISVPPHHQMKAPKLSPGEVNDIAAYIRSLRS